MTKQQIEYDDGTTFLSYHGNHGYFLPFVELRMDHMAKNGPFDVWLKDKYTDGDITVLETDTVIDCGSFAGAFSIAAAGMGAKKVYAIEPSSRNYACVVKNIEHFSAGDIVEPINIGLGNVESTLKLNLSEFSCEDSFLQPDQKATGEVEEVKVRKLSNLIDELGIDSSNLYLKVEAEGFEPEIIWGLDDHRPRVITVDVSPERDNKSPREDIRAFLAPLGYEFRDTKRCLFAFRT